MILETCPGLNTDSTSAEDKRYFTWSNRNKIPLFANVIRCLARKGPAACFRVPSNLIQLFAMWYQLSEFCTVMVIDPGLLSCLPVIG